MLPHRSSLGLPISILTVALLAAACSAHADQAATAVDTSCKSDGACAVTPNTPLCDLPTGACVALPPGHEIGWRDGAVDSVDMVGIYDPGASKREATDLKFHPTRTSELWVALREFDDPRPCTDSNKQGCAALEGRVAIITNPGGAGVTWNVTKDPNALHFMRRPPALAFGAGDTFGTCGEFRTGNATDDPLDYIGPTLFSSDPKIWAKQPPGKNGSHLDMLHESPFCVGVAWERDNVYWAFNGKNGAVDRYDFHSPHEIGGEDHSNGELRRYNVGLLKRVAGVPGHMVYNQADGQLYIADTGNGRIVKLDPGSGSGSGKPAPLYDPIKLAELRKDASVVEVVAPGTLTAPSGLWIKDEVLFVSDNATSRFYAFDLQGKLLRTLDTKLPAGSLAGITVGPDDRFYFVDKSTSWVYRIEPK